MLHVGQQYRHLSDDERDLIQAMLPTHSLTQIGRALGRHPSTISREVRRNSWRPSSLCEAYRPYRPKRVKSDFWTQRAYVASRAITLAAKRRAHGRVSKMSQPRLLNYVITKLRSGWSPLVISGRLALDFPDDEQMRVCAETIYAWIYSSTKQARAWAQYLARHHRRRHRYRGGKTRSKSSIRQRVGITHRPHLIEARQEVGHWEADTVVCRGGSIHTLVDRKSRMLLAEKVPNKSASAALRAQVSMLQQLPGVLCRSVTSDNGTEFAAHHVLGECLGVLTYFADPYSSWQRGSNENRNGILRRYLPKGTDITDLADWELQEIVDEINNRPLRVLGYRTPAEIHNQALGADKLTPHTPTRQALHL